MEPIINPLIEITQAGLANGGATVETSLRTEVVAAMKAEVEGITIPTGRRADIVSPFMH